MRYVQIMKQLGVATISYVKENSGLYMSNWKDDNWADEGRLGPVDDSSWHYKLKDYLSLTMTGKGQYEKRIPNVLQCPSEPKSYKDNSVRTYNSYKFTRRHGDAKNQRGLSLVIVRARKTSQQFPILEKLWQQWKVYSKALSM